MKTHGIRIAFALAVMVWGALAHADVAAGTPKFTWTLPTRPATALPYKETRIICDGDLVNPKVVAMPTLVWQAPVGAFNIAVPHPCYARIYDTAGTPSPDSNTVTFTIPAVAPPAPVLSVQ